MKTETFDGKLGIQQRVLPAYRVAFFSKLAQACTKGMSLFAGEPRPDEGIASANALPHGEFAAAKNLHLLRGKTYFCWQHGLTSWLRDWDPDALIVEANPRWLTTRQAIRWMKRRRRPILGWGLGAPAQSGWQKSTWRAYLQQFDALLAYSQRGAREYRLLGFPAQRIFVAHNAVLPAPRWGLPTRSIAPHQLTVLFVGRLQARKRVDLLIQACALLPEALQPRLWIVGDGPERERLQALAQDLYPYTHFWGTLHGKDLQPLWLQSDLFVLPGTGGLAIQEAMSYGLPVIVARGDGTQEDLVHPSTGWLIPPEDLSALRDALQQALQDIPSLRTMGAAAYRHVGQTANIDYMVNAFVHALNSIL